MNNKERVKNWRKIFQEKNPEGYLKWKKESREKFCFGKSKEKLSALFGKKCNICGITKKELEIHHKDGSGASKKANEKNNDLSNLQILCRKCHRQEDARRIQEERKGMWSLHYANCVVCKKTDSKYISFGLCNKCYQKTRRKYKTEYWNKHYKKSKNN